MHPYSDSDPFHEQRADMRIVYHLGAHCTDEERLLRCLLKNRQVLADHATCIPAPARYRNLLRDTAISLKGQAAPAALQSQVLSQIIDAQQAERLVLSWENFLSFPQWALKERLYPAAAERIRAFTQIFPDHQAEFHLAIRNPASFLPELYAKQRDKSYEAFMAGTDPLLLSWAEMIEDVLELNPGTPLTIWCDEDTPLIWPEVLQAVAGHPSGVVLSDQDELLATLMPAEGLVRLRSYLESHAPLDVMQRRRIVSAFLDKFVQPEQNEIEIDFPGWSEATLHTLTENYRADIAYLRTLPNVTFITP